MPCIWPKHQHTSSEGFLRAVFGCMPFRWRGRVCWTPPITHQSHVASLMACSCGAGAHRFLLEQPHLVHRPNRSEPRRAAQ